MEIHADADWFLKKDTKASSANVFQYITLQNDYFKTFLLSFLSHPLAF